MKSWTKENYKTLIQTNVTFVWKKTTPSQLQNVYFAQKRHSKEQRYFFSVIISPITAVPSPSLCCLDLQGSSSEFLVLFYVLRREAHINYLYILSPGTVHMGMQQRMSIKLVSGTGFLALLIHTEWFYTFVHIPNYVRNWCSSLCFRIPQFHRLQAMYDCTYVEFNVEIYICTYTADFITPKMGLGPASVQRPFPLNMKELCGQPATPILYSHKNLF